MTRTNWLPSLVMKLPMSSLIMVMQGYLQHLQHNPVCNWPRLWQARPAPKKHNFWDCWVLVHRLEFSCLTGAARKAKQISSDFDIWPMQALIPWPVFSFGKTWARQVEVNL